MEKVKETIDFDYDQYYYFLQDDNYIIYPKTISEKELKIARGKYYEKTNCRLFSYLFESTYEYKKYSSYKFIALDLTKIDEDTKSKIIMLVKELFNEVEVFEQRGLTIYIYFENLDLDFQSILEAINDDFSTKIKAFISGKLMFKNKHAFKHILDAYLQFSYNQNTLVTSTRSLIVDISKANYKRLKQLQAPLLNKVGEDNQLKDLINSMFNNNLNVTKTAGDVYMHRNTINNKLDLILEETGLNMQNFNDAVAMYLLIKA